MTVSPSAGSTIAQVGAVEIIPAHYYETVAFNRSTLEPPLGSGPYRVEAVDPGRSVTYCRTPDYWGADLPVNVGRNNFDCYRYEYFADTTAAFEVSTCSAPTPVAKRPPILTSTS